MVIQGHVGRDPLQGSQSTHGRASERDVGEKLDERVWHCTKQPVTGSGAKFGNMLLEAFFIAKRGKAIGRCHPGDRARTRDCVDHSGRGPFPIAAVRCVSRPNLEPRHACAQTFGDSLTHRLIGQAFGGLSEDFPGVGKLRQCWRGIPPKFKDKEPIHPGVKDRQFYRNAEGLAEDVKYYGEWMREKAWERIGHLYPQVELSQDYGGGKATVIAWIWARTVPSPDPAFADVQVPLASSFLLSSKAGNEVWIEPIVDKAAKTIAYKIRIGGTKAEIEAASEGTKAGRGSNFRCIISNTAITPEYVKGKGKSGAMGQTLIAIVAEGKRSRAYVAPTDEHENLAFAAKPEWEPETKLPNDPRNFWTVDYGLTTFGDLFTDRQLVTLNTFSDLVHEALVQAVIDAQAAGFSDDPTPLRNGGTGAIAYAEAVSVYLGFGVSRLSDIQNSLCRWESSKTQVRNLFGRQAIPMMWDFGENNAFADAAGDYRTSLGSIVKVIERFSPAATGVERNNDAQTVAYPQNTVISTDPPYYDNIGYADLSDFFFCWLKPALRPVYPEIFGVLATPKADELVATPYRHGGKDAAEAFFLDGMSRAIANMAVQSSDLFPATIYYAFKQSEVAKDGISSTGWATFLQAVVEAGYAVVGTWPMRTEMANRMIASGTNALANSVVLVCRKKEATAEVITRAEFVRALKRELPPAIAELQVANIAPADMPQSAIGPGMGVFSRYKAVLESDDSPMSVKTALQLINRELDEYLGGIQGEFDADTRFAITWFEQNGNGKGDYGVADNLARARGISVESVKHAGIVESAAGKVRILTRDELDEDWEPESDSHLTVWECLQHLVRLRAAALEAGAGARASAHAGREPRIPYSPPQQHRSSVGHRAAHRSWPRRHRPGYRSRPRGGGMP